MDCSAHSACLCIVLIWKKNVSLLSDESMKLGRAVRRLVLFTPHFDERFYIFEEVHSVDTACVSSLYRHRATQSTYTDMCNEA